MSPSSANALVLTVSIQTSQAVKHVDAVGIPQCIADSVEVVSDVIREII